MDIRLTVNGKEVALTEEQIKLLGLAPEKKKTGYERMDEEGKYFVQNSSGFATELTDARLKMCQEQYDAANYYSDLQVCRDNAIADKLMRHLRRFAAENGGIPSLNDWTTPDGSIPRKAKYYIEFNTTIEQLYAASCNRVRAPGVVYFLSQNACEKAIEVYWDELIWYFTEYEPMLHDGGIDCNDIAKFPTIEAEPVRHDEAKKVCPVNGAPCNECVPGAYCAKMAGGAE